MENQLTNDEALKVFAMHFNARVQEDISKNATGECPAKYVIWRAVEYPYPALEKFKLLLTPLSAISKDHVKEISEALIEEEIPDENITDERVQDFMALFNEPDGMPITVNEYLKSKGYDVPLWFGIGHWANGKTAIELGIAIAKTA